MHYVDEELFQLVTMASMFLAIKLHSPKKVSISSIAVMGRGLIDVEHIESMKLSIAHSLEWHLHHQTPMKFIENICPLVSDIMNSEDFSATDALEHSRFLTELSVCAYPFVAAKPSYIAIAAILNMFEHFHLSVSEETQASFKAYAGSVCLGVEVPEVEECCKLLRWIYRLAIPNASPVSGLEPQLTS